jgi:hypothetical protein
MEHPQQGPEAKPIRLPVTGARGLVGSVGSQLIIAGTCDNVSIDVFDEVCAAESVQLGEWLENLLPRRTFEKLARELNSRISPGPKNKLVTRLKCGHDEGSLKEFRDGFSHRFEVLVVIDPTM